MMPVSHKIKPMQRNQNPKEIKARAVSSQATLIGGRMNLGIGAQRGPVAPGRVRQ